MNDKLLPAKQKADTIRALLEHPQTMNQMKKAIPHHLTVERLLRVSMTSIQRTPRLLECTPNSLLACIMTCAQLGLEPDQFLGQAYLVPFYNSKKKTYEAQLIPGYRGFVDLARRSGRVLSVSSQVVYTNDEFEMEYGIEEKLRHVPADGERGEPKGVYVVFQYKDNSHSFDYMSTADVEKIRKRSKTPDAGPWVTDWDEMAKKTVIKRHCKLVPMSIEFAQASRLEDYANMGASQMGVFGDITGEPDADGEMIDAEKVDTQKQGDDWKDEGPAGAPGSVVDAEFTARDRLEAEVVKPSGIAMETVDKFIKEWAEKQNASEEEIIAAALENRKAFLTSLIKWAKTPDETVDKKEADPELEAIRKEYLHKRKGTPGKKGGFQGWVNDNLIRIKTLPEELQVEIRDKWVGFYPEKAYPLDKAPETGETSVTFGEAPSTAEGDPGASGQTEGSEQPKTEPVPQTHEFLALFDEEVIRMGESLETDIAWKMTDLDKWIAEQVMKHDFDSNDAYKVSVMQVGHFDAMFSQFMRHVSGDVD